MRPLSDLPDAMLQRLFGVAFDIDDTVSTHGLIHPDAFAALWALRDTGLALVAVTGRPLGWADAMASTWPIDAAVGENGAGWSYRKNGALAIGGFDDAGHAALLERVREAVKREHPDIEVAADQSARRADLAFDIGERVHLAPDRVAAIVDTVRACGARALVSSVQVHVVPGAWDKAEGARRAVHEALGVELVPSRWLYVGDSGNDEAAFAFFEITVGVANVRDHLARLATPPRWVTNAERGKGFAELAQRIVEARSRG